MYAYFEFVLNLLAQCAQYDLFMLLAALLLVAGGFRLVWWLVAPRVYHGCD